MEMDFEDFIEEIKFQMTEYDILEEEIILDWEERVRQWMKDNRHKSCVRYKSEDDILIRVRNEDAMEEIALKFYKAVRNQQEDKYWKTFELI